MPAVAPKSAKSRPMPNSVLGLIWQSACSNSFCGVKNFGVIVSRKFFLSLSNACLRKMSWAFSASRERLPTSRSRRAAVWGVLSRKATAATPTSAATAKNTSAEIINGVMRFHSTVFGFRGSVYCKPKTGLIPQQHSFLEQIRGQFDAGRLQTIDEGRPHARRFKLAESPAVLVDAQLPIAENVLHDNHVLLHAHDFGDRSHLARAALQAVGLNDDIDRR